MSQVASAQPAASAPNAASLPPGLALPEPLPTGDVRAGPGQVPLVALALLVVVPASLVWCAMAARQAWWTDPFRARRSAQRSLQKLVAAMQSHAPTREELESWRLLTVRVWALPQAVPTLDELAAGLRASPSPSTWVVLWHDAEEALYSPRPQLRAEWLTRAEAAARQLPLLPKNPWWPDQPRHWWPSVASVMVAAAVTVAGSLHSLGAADALASYQAGRFAEAGKAWLAQVAQQPGDWAMRHNAALALAQQDQWGNSAGHWTAAFLLNPNQPAVMSGLKTSLLKIETADPALQRLLDGGAWDRLVSHHAVVEWQQFTGVGAFTLSLGLVALVISLYRASERGWRWGGLAAAVAGFAVAGISLLAVQRYGPMADSQAAFVTHPAELRSIPSDLVGKQQTSTLFAGTIVKVHRSFLGWDQISIRGDVAGWVRSDTLVWIYRSRNNGAAATILK